MAGAGGSMSTGAAQRILQAVDTAFTVERIQTTVLGEMRKGLDATTVLACGGWNATSLGQKLLTLEQASKSSTDQNRRLADGQAALEKANEARRKALADILDATKAVDGRIEIALVTAVAMMRGVNAATPGAGTLPPENQLRSQLQSQMTRGEGANSRRADNKSRRHLCPDSRLKSCSSTSDSYDRQRVESSMSWLSLPLKRLYEMVLRSSGARWQCLRADLFGFPR